MLNIPVIRWGKPYESLDVGEVVHFESGEPIAKVSQANGGLIQRDARKSDKARQALRQIPPADLSGDVQEGCRPCLKTEHYPSAMGLSRQTNSSTLSRQAQDCPSTCVGPT